MIMLIKALLSGLLICIILSMVLFTFFLLALCMIQIFNWILKQGKLWRHR